MDCTAPPSSFDGAARPRTGRRLRLWLAALLACAAVSPWLGAPSTRARADDAAAVQADDTPAADEAHPSPNDHGAGGHVDRVAKVLAAIVLILLLAKIGGDLVERIGMPAVLGELIVGIVLGNMAFLTGWDGLRFLHAPPDINVARKLAELERELEGAGGDASAHRERLAELRREISEVEPYSAGAALKMLAEIGVVLLLFEVGLESSVAGMMAVGASSFLVAVVGVVTPMALGWAVGLWLIPDRGWQVHMFIGATLTATSVGITARVLKDLGRSQQRESRIILGAAVIDDVLGLMVLAIVQGIIQSGSDFSAGSIVIDILKAVGFLFGAILLGNHLTRPLFRAATYLRGHGLLVVTSLVICFAFAWLASLVHLAPIVGAFAAGLILEKVHYQELGQKEEVELEEALKPLTALLVPIFFVQMGIMVDLRSFTDPAVWGLAAAVTAAAVIGKQACYFGVLERGLNRLAVGLGMIPRGEVGLIFAAVGSGLTSPSGERIIDADTYSAAVVMVILTTMVTPPLLKWAMTRGAGNDDG